MLVTLVAVVWWGFTYGQMAIDLGSSFDKALSCLYTSGGMCGLASGFSKLGGGTPYEPMLFWAGVVLLLVGLVLGFLKKR